MQDKTLKTNAMTKETQGEGTVMNQEQKQRPSENVAIGGLFLVVGIGLMLINWLMVLITNHYFVKMSFVGPSFVCLGVAMMIPVRKFNKETPLQSQVNTEEQLSKKLSTRFASYLSCLVGCLVLYLAMFL